MKDWLSIVVIGAICLFDAFISYRMYRLLGHWEYGVLTFIVVGRLANISGNTNKN
jgi:hypothetical protein